MGTMTPTSFAASPSIKTQTNKSEFKFQTCLIYIRIRLNFFNLRARDLAFSSAFLALCSCTIESLSSIVSSSHLTQKENRLQHAHKRKQSLFQKRLTITINKLSLSILNSKSNIINHRNRFLCHRDDRWIEQTQSIWNLPQIQGSNQHTQNRMLHVCTPQTFRSKRMFTINNVACMHTTNI